jgi:putative inorganic carbon (HCO3(-)) transporter
VNTLDLAPVGGALASLGLAFLFAGRGQGVRLGGIGLGTLGCCLLGVPLAPAGHEGFVVAAFVVAALVCGGLGLVLRRWPWALAFSMLLFVPARIPLRVDGLHGKFLLPLYVLAGAAAVQLAVETLQGDERSRELGPLSVPLAAFVLWTGLSLTWSKDVHAGAVELLAFYLPFGTLALALARLPWSRRALRWLAVEVAAMALLFAAVGFWQHQTKSIFWNPKVINSNAYAPFFRVNSVFWDPSIYGRFLVIAIGVAVVAVVRGRSPRLALAATAAIVVLWVGLLLSYSQSSFAALAAAVTVVALVAWGRRAAPAVALAVLVVLALGVTSPRVRHAVFNGGLNASTSGRASLVSGGIHVAADNPVLGVGVGGFRRAYADRYHLKGREPKKAASHDTPVTVVAESGVPGLVLYAWLVLTALATAFRRLGRRFDVRVATSLGVVLVAIVVHSLGYADFFEDPTTWGLLGLLGLTGTVLARQAAARARPPAEGREPVPGASEPREKVRA